MKIVPLLLHIVIFSLFMFPNPVLANEENPVLIENVRRSQSTFNSSQFIVDIIDTLTREATYENGKLMGWPFRLDGPFENSERMYRGYKVGMAGIGDFLLNAYIDGYPESKPLLDEIIQHYIDNALDSLAGGTYWGRFSNEDTAGWTGLRYGVSGIIKFLSRVVKLNYSADLVTLINGGYAYLKSMQLSDRSWPMTEDGYITSGSQYGATGIGFAMLELYENLGNSTYLEESIDIGNYLLSVGVWRNDQFLISWTPQSLGSEFDGLVIYGKSAGIAGIADYLGSLYEITGNVDYLNTMIGIGNTIVGADFGGYWANGSVSYVSKIYSSNIALTGYDVGSSGIAQSLLEIYDQRPNATLLNSSATAEKFVLSLLNKDFSLPVGLVYVDNKLTGKSLGTAGVALFQLQLYERFGSERHLELAFNILDHLYSLYKGNSNLPLDETDLSFGYSFNLEDGIAGIGNILLFLENSSSGTGNEMYEQLFLAATPNLTLSQISTKETNNSDSSYPSIYFSLLIIITVIKMIRTFRKRV